MSLRQRIYPKQENLLVLVNMENQQLYLKNVTSTKMEYVVQYTGRNWVKHGGLIVVAVSAIVGNSLLILTVLKNRHLHTVTNMFIVSLAIADFMFGFPTVPFHILAEGAQGAVLGVSLPTLCLVAMSLSGFQVIITVLTLLMLTIERYICFLHPLKHRKWAQKRKVCYVICALWLYALAFGMVPLMGWNTLMYHNPWQDHQNLTQNASVQITLPRCSFLVMNTGPYIGLLFLVHILPACLLLPLSYGRMFCAIKQFVARLGNQAEPVVSAQNIQQARNVSKRLSGRRSLPLIVICAMYGVFSWIPTMIWYGFATHGFTKTFMTPRDLASVPLPTSYYQVATLLGVFNSSINPYIYGLGSVPIRRAFFTMISNMKSCRFSKTK